MWQRIKNALARAGNAIQTAGQVVDWDIAALVGYIIAAVLSFVGVVLAFVYDSLAIYWISLFLGAALMLIGATFITPLAEVLGYYFAKLIRDNNYRWFTMVGLSVIFTVSAFIAGFGEPIVNKDIIRPAGQLIEETSRPWSEEISKRWNGESLTANASAAITTVAQTQKTSEAKRYHSWYHIKFAIFCWIATFIYMFFAFSDEAKEAWQEAIEAVKGVEIGQKRTMETVVITLADQAPTIQTGGAKATDAVETFFKKHLGRLLSLEVIGEFLASFIQKVFKTIFKS